MLIFFFFERIYISQVLSSPHNTHTLSETPINGITVYTKRSPPIVRGPRGEMVEKFLLHFSYVLLRLRLLLLLLLLSFTKLSTSISSFSYSTLYLGFRFAHTSLARRLSDDKKKHFSYVRAYIGNRFSSFTFEFSSQLLLVVGMPVYLGRRGAVVATRFLYFPFLSDHAKLLIFIFLCQAVVQHSHAFLCISNYSPD